MKFRDFIIKNHKWFIVGFIVLSLPAIYLLVYYTGGIKYVYSHTMYIPIVLAGVVLGPPYGVLTALAASILLGPLMPIDVSSGESQDLINWLYRMLIFMSVGALTDFFTRRFRLALAANRSLTSVNQETYVPNINFLELLPDDKRIYSTASVIISDKNNINEVFGYKVFNRVINMTYMHLTAKLPLGSYIIQSDSHVLWVLVPFGETTKDTNLIVDSLKEPIIIDDVNIFVEFYIGAGKSGTLAECKNLEAFREADRYARFAEKNNLPYAIYDENKVIKQYQFNLLSDFKKALETDQTYLTYHPVIDLKTMTISKFEALIRWLHPEKGLIMPGDFIPLIENTQLVHPLIDWVVTKGLVKLEEFNKNNIKTNVAFNVSGKNFNDSKLYTKVMAFLKQNKIKPEQVSLEITETVLMENPESSKEVIRKFKNAGISIAIDDFGKGYSSFAYLSQFAIDYVKIDRYFISKIKDESVYEIVRATINLAHQLNFKVVAEGVETLEMLEMIKNLNCDYAQGFYFGKPVHQDEVINYYLNYYENIQQGEEKQ